jgi:ribosomal protein L37AE/L43A
MDEQIDLFTERYKFKDIVAEMEKSEQKGVKKDLKNLKELTKSIAKEYNLKEEDVEFIRKKNPLKAEDVKIEDGERAAIRYVNTADVDRDNEIVMPDGGLVKDFQKSMTVLYAHNYSDLPIGRDLWIKLIKGKGWLVKTLYAEHHFLNTSSIGFIPLESITPDSKGWDKVKAKLVDIYGIKEKLIDDVRRIYTKWLLLEHSDVPIPSNINALNIAVGKGFIKSEDILKDLQDEIEIIENENKEKEEIIVEGVNEKGEKVKETLEIDDEDEFICPECGADVERDEDDDYLICTKCDWNDANAGSKEAIKKIKDEKDIINKPEEIEGVLSAEEKMGFNLDEIYEIVKENKGLKEKINISEKNSIINNISIIKLKEELAEAEIKAGAVLNKKNKTDLIEGQKRIQNVLDSAASGEGKADYKCECLKCGWEHTSEKHCDSYKCEKCGGEMRNVNRPGPGKEIILEDEPISEEDNFEFEEKKKEEKKPEEIGLNPDEIKDIIVQAISENVKGVKEGLSKRIDDNFKKATGKVV